MLALQTRGSFGGILGKVEADPQQLEVKRRKQSLGFGLCSGFDAFIVSGGGGGEWEVG